MSRTQGAFDIVLAIGLLYLRDDQQTAPLLGAACRRLKPDARTATLGPALTAFSKVVTRSPTFFACPIRMSSWSARLEARAGLLGRSSRCVVANTKLHPNDLGADCDGVCHDRLHLARAAKNLHHIY